MTGEGKLWGKTLTEQYVPVFILLTSYYSGLMFVTISTNYVGTAQNSPSAQAPVLSGQHIKLVCHVGLPL